MGIRLKTKRILFLRATRFLCQYYRKASDWIVKPKAIVMMILAGYLCIFIVWLFYLAITRQPAIVATVTAPTNTQPQVEQPSVLRRFSGDAADWLSIWGIIVVIITYIADKTNKKWEDLIRSRGAQKERIRLLDDFGPTPEMITFFDNRSIYNAIISVINRLSEKQLKNDGKPHYNVCLLLCSPALDYWHNPKTWSENVKDHEWGKEFRDIVERLAANPDVQFDICHLPVGSHSGINAMNDFIAALSTYIARPDGQSKTDNEFILDDKFQEIFKKLLQRAILVATDFQTWATHEDKKNRFVVKTHTINIPFQIVLVNGDDFTEVVVSFAGRDVLEREQKSGVKGFYSSDPYVVKTFHDVFNTYVESRGRIPYIPPHTRKVVAEHDSANSCDIEGFYYNFIEKLQIVPEVFSPAIGNSSKFTVWLLDKLLTTGNLENPSHWCNRIQKILDVGAGTGVLALAVGAILHKRLNRKNYKIIALDSCPHAQKILKINCAVDENIFVHLWSLKHDYNNEHGEIKSSWFEESDGKKIEINDEFGKFDLIIGDMPFIHAKERTATDLRFLDFEHQLHQALLWVSAHTVLLAQNGLLVTAFSSLGGPEDIADFERHIRSNSLQLIQRVDFYESGYMWMVYVLMKKQDYDSYGDQLWWDILDAKNTSKELKH